MPGITLNVPSTVLPNTPPPKNSAPYVDIKPARSLAPSKLHSEEDIFFSLPRGVSPPLVSNSHASSHGQSVPSSTTDAEETDDDAEEHTLSAYGDVSLSEDFVVPSPPTSGIQRKTPRSRLRLKVRRPPMPKRRLSYVHASGGKTPVSGEVIGTPWPGSPSPICPHTPLHQHQPLISPLSADLPSTGKSGSNSDLSVRKLVDDLMPRSPLIRLSAGKSHAQGIVDKPAGPRASQGPKAAQITTPYSKQEVKDPPASRQSPPPTHVTTEQIKHAAPQSERKCGGGGGGWRTRLPPRPPIPKWDL